jgi:pimeloyl-ACP methyl ester carboxylesterase
VPGPLVTFTNDDLRFDVLDQGPETGEVIVALHGFPQLSSCWDAVTPTLTGAGYRVLAPDQRGYSPGARPAKAKDYRLDLLGGDVLALADAAGADRVHLLGHDWGAAVAWYLASRRADRVRSLSVVSTPHPRALIKALRGRQLLMSWYMPVLQLPWLPEVALRSRNAALTRRMLGRSGLPTVRQEETAALLAEPGAATATLNWYRAMRTRHAPGPGRVAVPTLYVWGDHDAALGRAAADHTAEWVTGPYRFEILKGASHWIPDERPNELANLVLAQVLRHND